MAGYFPISFINGYLACYFLSDEGRMKLKQLLSPRQPRPSSLIKQSKSSVITGTEELKAIALYKNGHAHTLIVDELSSSWGYRDVASDLIPVGAIPLLDKGEITYVLGFDGKKLWPIDFMPLTDDEDKTPQDCFEAQCWDELDIVLKMVSSLAEKIKLGIFVGLAVGELIVLFLIASIAMGGKPPA